MKNELELERKQPLSMNKKYSHFFGENKENHRNMVLCTKCEFFNTL
jgi:hypothetical protein